MGKKRHEVVPLTAAEIKKAPGFKPNMPEGVPIYRIADLLPYKRNAKEHPQAQIDKVAASIKEFGFTNPTLLEPDGTFVAGHCRHLAALQLGMTIIPGFVVGWLNPVQRKALRIADNKLAESAWTDDLLALELRDLATEDFDLSLVGFDDDELRDILAEPNEGNGDADADAPPAPKHPVSVPGDVWILGKHRLICGDNRDPNVVAIVLGGVRPNLMVTDPPYGVNHDPEWRDKAPIKRSKEHTAKGKVQNDDTASWRATWQLFTGDIAYVWHSGLHGATVHADLANAKCVDAYNRENGDGSHDFKRGTCTTCGSLKGFVMRAQIIWAKERIAVSRGAYHWQHEPCLYMVRDGGKGDWHGDRKQSTIWSIAHRKSETGHSTQKPVECMSRPIVNHTSPGHAVYDPFVGSGTTLIACEMLDRIAYAIEIDPAYVDVALRRWEEFTSERATHEDSGMTYAELAAERGVDITWSIKAAE